MRTVEVKVGEGSGGAHTQARRQERGKESSDDRQVRTRDPERGKAECNRSGNMTAFWSWSECRRTVGIQRRERPPLFILISIKVKDAFPVKFGSHLWRVSPPPGQGLVSSAAWRRPPGARLSALRPDGPP
jgi:hypothetical protein